MTAPPVKEVALGNDIAVYQPASLRSVIDRDPIAAAHPDLFVVAAYGRIFGPRLLAIPRLGSVNLHASLLPEYRGASPISAAILEGCPETGITLMRMNAGLDTGPILAQRSLTISPEATTASLTPQLAQLGAKLLTETLPKLVEGTLVPTSQDDQWATITRPLVKADGWIDWAEPAETIERHIRAMWDWPRGWTTLRGEPIQVHRAMSDDTTVDAPPGTVIVRDGAPLVATGKGHLIIEIAQSAGNRPLAGGAWLLQSGASGEILGTSGAPDSPMLPMIRRVDG